MPDLTAAQVSDRLFVGRTGPDTRYGPFTIVWSGWQQYPGLLRMFGYWMAVGPGPDHRSHVQTTGGHYGRYRDGEMVDDSRSPQWPEMTPLTVALQGPSCLTDLQTRAYWALVDHLHAE